MHVYNAIIIMKELLPVFPLSAVTDTGASLDAAMDRFIETEDRGDLKILGRAYVYSHQYRCLTNEEICFQLFGRSQEKRVSVGNAKI